MYISKHIMYNWLYTYILYFVPITISFVRVVKEVDGWIEIYVFIHENFFMNENST